jgi:nucleotide-binding universal stress UspA family protein
MNASRIVCATDMSEVSRSALDLARVLAEWEAADLHVVRVGPPPTPSMRVIPSMRGARRLVHRNASGPQGRRAPYRLTSVVRSGEPVDTVIDYARSINAELIVVGTALPLAGLSRRESVGETIARRASCATLVVPPGLEPTLDDVPFRSIVCPVDFSPASVAAFEEAVRLAQSAGGALTLVHVMDEVDDAPTVARHLVPEYLRLREADAQQRLWASIPREALNWADIDVRVSAGDAGERILGLAAELRADLIVMGVMSRSPLNRLLFASTTRRVTGESTCPVLVVRPPTSAPAWDHEYVTGRAWPQSQPAEYSRLDLAAESHGPRI